MKKRSVELKKLKDDEPQSDKIKYLINGFVNLTDHEMLTEDFVLTYYDLMRNLRMVDIAVLRLYCNRTQYEHQSHESFDEVMERHGLTIAQYDSVRNNLYRLGLLTSVSDIESMRDLDSLFESIKEIHKYLERVAKGKTLPKLKEPKIRSKERFRVSKFGRQFHDFFLNVQK